MINTTVTEKAVKDLVSFDFAEKVKEVYKTYHEDRANTELTKATHNVHIRNLDNMLKRKVHKVLYKYSCSVLGPIMHNSTTRSKSLLNDMLMAALKFDHMSYFCTVPHIVEFINTVSSDISKADNTSWSRYIMRHCFEAAIEESYTHCCFKRQAQLQIVPIGQSIPATEQYVYYKQHYSLHTTLNEAVCKNCNFIPPKFTEVTELEQKITDINLLKKYHELKGIYEQYPYWIKRYISADKVKRDVGYSDKARKQYNVFNTDRVTNIVTARWYYTLAINHIDYDRYELITLTPTISNLKTTARYNAQTLVIKKVMEQLDENSIHIWHKTIQKHYPKTKAYSYRAADDLVRIIICDCAFSINTDCGIIDYNTAEEYATMIKHSYMYGKLSYTDKEKIDSALTIIMFKVATDENITVNTMIEYAEYNRQKKYDMGIMLSNIYFSTITPAMPIV